MIKMKWQIDYLQKRSVFATCPKKFFQLELQNKMKMNGKQMRVFL